MIEYITLSGGLFGDDGSGSMDWASLWPWLAGAAVIAILIALFVRRR